MTDRSYNMEEAYASILRWFSDNYLEIAIAISASIIIVFALLGLKALILRGTSNMAVGHNWPALIAAVTRKTRMWFLIALSARMVQGYADPPQVLAQTISFLFVVAAVFQAAFWARTFVLELIQQRAMSGNPEDETNLASALRIIELLVSVAIFAIAAILILDNLGVNVTGLVAGLGIGGIAIGLAAQGIFSDLFAALTIIFDKPFRVGDVITYNGNEGPITGTVEEIGLKSSRIRSLTGELRIIGNAQLLAQEVTNYTGRSVYRLHLPVGVTYQTPPDVAETIPALMKQLVEEASARFIRANFVGFGASSIDFEVFFEADVDNIVAAQGFNQKVALGILRCFNERGIEFAYPTQTTFTAAPDGKMIMPYPENALIPVRDMRQKGDTPLSGQ